MPLDHVFGRVFVVGIVNGVAPFTGFAATSFRLTAYQPEFYAQ